MCVAYTSREPLFTPVCQLLFVLDYSSISVMFFGLYFQRTFIYLCLSAIAFFTLTGLWYNAYCDVMHTVNLRQYIHILYCWTTLMFSCQFVSDDNRPVNIHTDTSDVFNSKYSICLSFSFQKVRYDFIRLSSITIIQCTFDCAFLFRVLSYISIKTTWMLQSMNGSLGFFLMISCYLVHLFYLH